MALTPYHTYGWADLDAANKGHYSKPRFVLAGLRDAAEHAWAQYCDLVDTGASRDEVNKAYSLFVEAQNRAQDFDLNNHLRLAETLAAIARTAPEIAY